MNNSSNFCKTRLHQRIWDRITRSKRLWPNTMKIEFLRELRQYNKIIIPSTTYHSSSLIALACSTMRINTGTIKWTIHIRIDWNSWRWKERMIGRRRITWTLPVKVISLRGRKWQTNIKSINTFSQNLTLLTVTSGAILIKTKTWVLICKDRSLLIPFKTANLSIYR